MPLIYCETIRKTKLEFELMQTRYVGADIISDTVIPYHVPSGDRLEAAIINVGFACADLSKLDTDIKIVGIESDKDGKDVRNGGEHDALFSMLSPRDDFEGRKLRSLYHGYERYLGRIVYLMRRYDIKAVLQHRDESPRYN